MFLQLSFHTTGGEYEFQIIYFNTALEQINEAPCGAILAVIFETTLFVLTLTTEFTNVSTREIFLLL